MRETKEQLDLTLDSDPAQIRSVDWGDMNCASVRLSAGVDFTPLLEGLPRDHCQAPHWGYVLKGSLHVTYEDGREEVIEAGELYHRPSGHTAWVEEDTEYVEFSPRQGMHEVIEHVKGKMQA